ncbi:MAG: hypothetical protein DCC55_33980 [Chloroflexi bacterium]|nr:MAG: hypothetical protein DCC55_33980 [Chloroflexota bacterium]
METINWTPIIIVALLVVVAIVFALRYRGGGKATLRGPFGTSVEAEGRNPAPPRPGSATVEDAQSGGNVRATATTGGDAAVRRAKAKGDIEASTDDAPKA